MVWAMEAARVCLVVFGCAAGGWAIGFGMGYRRGIRDGITGLAFSPTTGLWETRRFRPFRDRCNTSI